MFPAYSVAERVKNPSPSAAEFTAEQELIGCVNGLFYERVKGRTKCQEKIAVITARADDRTQKDIICGIAEEAFAADTDMVVFSNIYNHWIRGEFLNDRFIIQVPPNLSFERHLPTCSGVYKNLAAPFSFSFNAEI